MGGIVAADHARTRTGPEEGLCCHNTIIIVFTIYSNHHVHAVIPVVLVPRSLPAEHNNGVGSAGGGEASAHNCMSVARAPNSVVRRHNRCPRRSNPNNRRNCHYSVGAIVLQLHVPHDVVAGDVRPAVGNGGAAVDDERPVLATRDGAREEPARRCRLPRVPRHLSPHHCRKVQHVQVVAGGRSVLAAKDNQRRRTGQQTRAVPVPCRGCDAARCNIKLKFKSPVDRCDAVQCVRVLVVLVETAEDQPRERRRPCARVPLDDELGWGGDFGPLRIECSFVWLYCAIPILVIATNVKSYISCKDTYMAVVAVAADADELDASSPFF
eukprot:PhM_4_TR3527/c0_g1_i1/m.16739